MKAIAVEEVTLTEEALTVFTEITLSPAVLWKLVPTSATEEAKSAMPGVTPEIVGEPSPEAIANELTLEALPKGAVTDMGPVVAPEGTVTTSWVAVAETIVADTPLNATASEAAVALKFAPEIVTVVPAVPDVGEKENTATWLAVNREIETIFPLASYEYRALAPFWSVTPTNLPSSS